MPFGGNIAQYRQWAKEIPGIGGVQVYPVWAGGGTVKLSTVSYTHLDVYKRQILLVL